MITQESLEKGKQAAMEGRPLREVQAIYTNGASETRSRSECTLLWELMQRNPERAKEFLRKLELSCKQQDVVVIS